MNGRMGIIAGAFVAVTGALVGAAALSGCATAEPVETLRERGDHEFMLGRYDEAARAYQQIAFRHPGDWRAQYRLGLSRLQLGELSAARQALEVAHTRRPEDEDIVDALAEVMLKQDDEARLYAFLTERTRVSPSPRSYLRAARYALAMDDPDSARNAVQTAIELDHGWDVEPYLVAADLAERVGDRPVAVRRLRQAYWIDPDDARVSDRLRALGEVPGPTIALPPGK